MQAAAGRRQQRERLVQRDAARAAAPPASGEDKCPVELDHVELDEIAAALDRERERLGCVLGRERGRAPMADPAAAPSRRRRSITAG